MADLLKALRQAARSKDFRVAVSAVGSIDLRDGGLEVLKRSLVRGLLVQVRNEEAGRLGVVHSASLNALAGLRGSGLYVFRVAEEAPEARLPCTCSAVYPVKRHLKRLIRRRNLVFPDVPVDKCPVCQETFISVQVLAKMEMLFNTDKVETFWLDQVEQACTESTPEASLERTETVEDAAEDVSGAPEDPTIDADRETVDFPLPPADTGGDTAGIPPVGPAVAGENCAAGAMESEPVYPAVRTALGQLPEDGRYVFRRDLAMLLGLLWPE